MKLTKKAKNGLKNLILTTLTMGSLYGVIIYGILQYCKI